MAIYIDDRELVAAHQAGDSEAFDELVREHRRALLSHARTRLHCEAASEDALQETLVRAYKALPRFNGEYRLGPWLHRIMQNVCIDEANRRRRDGEKTNHYAAQNNWRDEAPSPEEELGFDFDDSALKAALDGLSEPYRQALELKFVEEYEYSELAAASGVSEQNARARVSRARLAMRSALKGVASLPFLLLAFLKRGEKVAAAATSASGVAAVSSGSAVTIAETGVAITHLAPNAVPLVTKAAVGIGLAAAVLTPTSDSPIHQAVDQLTSTAAGVVVELEVDAESSLNEAIVMASDVVQDSSDDSLFRSFTLDSTSIVATQDGAARFGLAGPLTMSDDVSETQLLLDESVSWIRVDPEMSLDGRYRVDGLLELRTPSGEFGSIRLAGFGIDELNGFAISGVFRAAGELTESVSEGSFNGFATLDSTPAELALRFDS